MLGNSANNSEKNIVLSFSLLMRLFEWCHEDAANDIAMHKVMEKIVAFSDGKTPLKIDTYETIIDGANDGQESDESEYASDEDMLTAYDLGQRQAENGMDLTNDLTKSASSMITAIKDNGYGVSNAEIEQFCQGYEECQPACCDLDSYYDDYEQPSTILSIDSEGNISLCDEECCQEPDEYEDEINKIIALSRI